MAGSACVRTPTTVIGVTNMTLLPAWVALLLALGLLAWRRESK